VRSRTPAWVRAGLILLGIGMLPVLTVLNGRLAPRLPAAAPFTVDYAAAQAWILRGQSPYSLDVTTTAEQLIKRQPGGLTQDPSTLIFVGPLPETYLMLPFVLLPVEWARAVWMTIAELGLLALASFSLSLARWQTRPSIVLAYVLFTLLFFPSISTVVLGGLGLIATLLLVGGLSAVLGEVDSVAGLCIGLAIVRPEVSALLALFVVVWAFSVRRWSLLGWTGGTALVVLLGSGMLASDWPLAWIRQILYFHDLVGLQLPLAAPISLFRAPQGLVVLVLAIIGLVYLLWEWALALSKPAAWFLWTACLTLVVAQLVTFAFDVSDLVVLLPVLGLIFRVGEERWKGAGQWGTLLGLMAFLGLPWVLYLAISPDAAASLNLATLLLTMALVGLWWSRYWAIRRRILAL
jgi:hypothetical protein